MLDLTRKEDQWLERMLERKNMVTSYKAFWLKAIVEEVQETESFSFTFDRLVCRMIAEAWFPLVQYRLNFGYQDQLQKIVDYLEGKYAFGVHVDKKYIMERLYFSGEFEEDKTFIHLKKQFYNMVPYRLINPFFESQTKGIKDQKKNRLIEQLSLESEECFYKIEKNCFGEKSITLSDAWEDYIYDNYSVISGWLQNKLILYLQSKNPSVPSIPYKLEKRKSRSLLKATKYWKKVNGILQLEDIYTGDRLSQENYSERGTFSIDHFVPWSFVMHDELWVTIPTFKHVNSAKNDRLPDLEAYMDDYCQMHYRAFTEMKSREVYKKTANNPMLDYLNLGGVLNSEEILHKDIDVSAEVFIQGMKETIVPLYQIAYNQGFEVWVQ